MHELHAFFSAFDEAADSDEALPERFEAGLPIPFSSQEAAEHGDVADGSLGWSRPSRSK
jgi:hypothetical protein